MALVPVGCRSSPGLTCCPREGGDSSIVLVAARGQRQTNGIRSHLRDEDHVRALQAGSSSIVILKLSNEQRLNPWVAAARLYSHSRSDRRFARRTSPPR